MFFCRIFVVPLHGNYKNGREGFAFSGFLQNEPPMPQNVSLYVVANSGLRLREKADATSAILATIPFGDSLKTDGNNLNYYDLVEKKSKLLFKFEDIEGYWQKVVYKGKKGYAFTGFLSEFYKPQIVNTSHILLEEGYSCGIVVQNTAEYNWFGWYKKGSKTSLKAIEKPLYSAFSGDYDNLITKTNLTAKGDTAMYIIGI